MLIDSFLTLLPQFVVLTLKTCKSVSIRTSNLKLCTVTSTKESHQIPKDQIPFSEHLRVHLPVFSQCVLITCQGSVK